MLQPSRGLSYAWDAMRPVGARVVPESLRLDGRPIEAERAYRVTVNDFLALGGDGFTVLRDGTDRKRGPLDVDALTEYLQRNLRCSLSPRTGSRASSARTESQPGAAPVR